MDKYERWERLYREKTGQPIPYPDYEIVIDDQTEDEYMEHYRAQDPWQDPWENEKT
jgi:hypothetical protein